MLTQQQSRRIAVLAASALLLGGWDWLKSPDPDIAEGNEAYSARDFDSALAAYDRSKSRHGVSAEIRFDVGAALYKMAEAQSDAEKKSQLFEKAESAFREAAESEDARLKSSAFHNLGNSMFLRERWPEAIEAYRKALRANQQNDNARYNLELALRKLKRENDAKSGQGPGQSQPKQPGQNGQKPQQGGDQGNDDSAQPGQGPPSQSPDSGSGDPQNQPQAGNGQNAQPSSPKQPQPNPGSGPNANSPQAPQANPNQPGAQAGKGAPQDAPTAPDSDGAEADAPPTKSDRDRKLDALESRSRDLRKRSLQRGGHRSGSRRNRAQKDW